MCFYDFQHFMIVWLILSLNTIADRPSVSCFVSSVLLFMCPKLHSKATNLLSCHQISQVLLFYLINLSPPFLSVVTVFPTNKPLSIYHLDQAHFKDLR